MAAKHFLATLTTMANLLKSLATGRYLQNNNNLYLRIIKEDSFHIEDN